MYLGIDLGGTNIAVGVVDEEGKLLCKKSVPTRAVRPAGQIVADMARAASELLKEYDLSLDSISSIGVGSPGAIDTNRGTVLSAGNLGFHNVPLADLLGAYFVKPIHVENDANCALWAEAKVGAASDAKSALMVTIGTGIGGAIVLNGELYGGINGFGGEFGMMVIGEENGVPMSFEDYSSASALVRQTEQAARQNADSLLWQCAEREGTFSGRTAFDAARLGDVVAQTVVDRYIEKLALGVSNLIHLFQPEYILIGGGVSHEGEALFAPLCEKVERLVYDYPIKKEKMTKIVAAALGNDAGIVGAALLGKDA